LVEPPRNLFVSWIKAQREIGGQHGGRVTLRRIMCVWNSSCAGAVLRGPLMRTSRALGQFPVVLEQGLEEVVAPLRRRAGPGDFQAAADGVRSKSFAEFIFPPQAL